jgi:hypothetical protein
MTLAFLFRTVAGSLLVLVLAHCLLNWGIAAFTVEKVVACPRVLTYVPPPPLSFLPRPPEKVVEERIEKVKVEEREKVEEVKKAKILDLNQLKAMSPSLTEHAADRGRA